jgi:hypothetical protein
VVEPKVSAQQIANALIEWRGNVQAAAEALGIRRNSLYERVRRLGLNLEAFRSSGQRVVPVTSVSGVSGGDRSGVSRPECPDHHARKNKAARFTGESSLHKLSSMEAPSEEGMAGAPIKAIPGRSRPPRLRPNQQDRLREAKLDLGARYRVETDENLILQQFFDETFEGWIDHKLAPAEAEGGRKKGRK